MLEQPEDRWFMAYALRVGRRTQGATAENPAVGCVVVQDGQIIGVGSTSPGGRPHGEPQALAMAGPRAKGATVYVTLEPCCHYGKSPPCTQALIAAGVGRVVVALQDVDPRVNGGGLAQLRAHDIAVTTGVLAAEAHRDLWGFIKRTVYGLPRVILKLGVCQNGRIAEKAGVRTAITGALSLKYAHLLRSQVDAILVGRQTLQTDAPALTCRLPGLEARSPLRVVLDSQLSAPYTQDMPLLQSLALAPVLIMATNSHAPLKKQWLEQNGAEVAIVAHSGPDHRCDLHHVLSTLAARGIQSVLVEGGASIAQSFLQENLVDEVWLFQSHIFLPETGVFIHVNGVNLFDFLEKSGNFQQEQGIGADTLKKYDIVVKNLQ